MAEQFAFEIHTPYRRFFAGDIETLVIMLSDGEIALYASHSFFIAPVETSILKMKNKDGDWLFACISSGILEVKGHNTILLVEAAEWPAEIDLARAQAAEKAALERINNSESFKIDRMAAHAALKRATTRIKAHALAAGHTGA
ncbi:MAG: ATP synthase F1 subunit epsilon [Spirochaetaceae bacterium]|jgi:F-type H+-transporting ATPase subunit epsilon|nr:ATP synthase F1 subunit epsilon [Spirochaetaceae bacterium]